MSRYDSLIENINKKTLFLNGLGFGEQGVVASKIDHAVFVLPDSERAAKMAEQISSLGKKVTPIYEFEKLFTISKFKSFETKTTLLKLMFALTQKDSVIVTTPAIFFCPLFDVDAFKSHIISFQKDNDYAIENLEKQLIEMGYKKVESVSSKGEFARRGDIIDIFNSTSENPVRLDFFDTQLEDIYEFDFLTYEKIKKLKSCEIVPNTILLSNEKQKNEALAKIQELKTQDNLFFDIFNNIEQNNDIPAEFLLPFNTQFTTIQKLDWPILINDIIEFETKFSKLFISINEKIDLTFENVNIKNLYKNSKFFENLTDFYENNQKKLVFLNNFNTDLSNLKHGFVDVLNLNFETINFPSFLNNLEKLKLTLNKYLDKKIYLCLSTLDTLNSIKKIFDETKVAYSTNKNSKGIILTDLKIPYNICYSDDEIFYIGSTNFAHKKAFVNANKTAIKYLPKAGEYVVHSIHGIGKCIGIVTVNVSGVDKEFFKILYKNDDTLYVPYENADCLSLYLTEGENVKLNKLGGKEFALQKFKAQQSIEDMSKELIELYAKRKATKGFKFPEDDYLYLEFENAFDHNETPDQMQAIIDVKNDMISGKVMDRLICGDVGFGKTEVAMRAMFKAVQAGKQVAILAPTTVLSLQHFMSAQKRCKDFGIRVEMLNRFKSPKEQKQIIEDLKSGDLDVVCGTHRLLSKDVMFKDLGLLILDEEQRFGVKAKEEIKQKKNNVDVLTLSATPIPRTLSMSLMSIRDISIINTPPVNRLPVKTYVIGFDENIIANAINDEVNRNGQVLVIYNNIENIHKLANQLKVKVNNEKAVFDVAHGQMSEVALENAIKRLYEKQTNVFISTTLIENGVDLPSANTLIVVDSDKLGLSQMYQLRGRVGRSDEQAYAYFTFNKDKVLSEDSSNRLQAIAENTELGSGFKIAMRDLQIRGAGELLGKIQHGHMIKIGYDMYSKLLNDTIKRLQGEKVQVERETKIDIAITSKIPYSFIEEESDRLQIIAKISNINSKEKARQVLNDLINQYGKLPQEIYQLTNIALLKSLANKQNVKNITITKQKMSIVYYSDIDVKNLMKKVQKFSHFKFENTFDPTISVDPKNFSIQTAMNYFIEFLCS